MIYLIGTALAAIGAEIWSIVTGYRRTSRGPKDRAQQRSGTGHFLVLAGPDRCRCGSVWPCLDSVPSDRLTRQI